MGRFPIALTMAGSRWSKNSVVPVSMAAIRGHLVVGEGEVEDVEVLRHPLGPHGLGDDDDVALGEPTQDDLGNGLAVASADLGQDRVGEQVVAALGEPAPGLVLDAALDHEVVVGLPLEVRVGLDLVDRRGEAGAVDEVDEPVGVEVRDADGPDRALLVEGAHGAPGAVVVTVGLMDQVEVEVVEAEALQRGVERLRGVLLARVLHPQLGGDEQLLAGDAAGGDGATDGSLVAVGGGGVEVAVAGRQGVSDGLLGLVSWDLEDAEAEDRHLDAIVEGDVRNLEHCGPSLLTGVGAVARVG